MSSFATILERVARLVSLSSSPHTVSRSPPPPPSLSLSLSRRQSPPAPLSNHAQPNSNRATREENEEEDGKRGRLSGRERKGGGMRVLLDAIGGCRSGLTDGPPFPYMMARPDKSGAPYGAE